MILKVWTVSSHRGHVVGVYLDETLARHSIRNRNFTLEEWQPTLTDNVLDMLAAIIEDVNNK